MREAFRSIVVAPVIAGLLVGGLILSQGIETTNTPEYAITVVN